MYEPRTDPPIATHHFVRRLINHAGLVAALILGSLFIGMCGYAYFEHLSWLDAFLNAAMLLGGMGPVDLPHSEGGKLFAGLYALYAGLVVLAVAGLTLAPFVHRLLHKFHWDADAD